ncbi:GrlR family regulatory protein [Bradyrhizobium prioriisuperbiae]|uniref:GrlR family regulatory protein n=1 Tax=Bradyrhizobium prioriisuperbiae TaxID=2854389 RepID=UPI0028F16FFB|nr:GrlR family regulatory protein [Bradyrhizobium prioritasuperba]
MRNGLYTIAIDMLDGVDARATGVIVLRDGAIHGGDSYFYYTGNYETGPDKWRGELVTHQHTQSRGNPVFGGRDVSVGFSGKHDATGAVVYGTALVGSRSVSFRATLRRLADA